MIGFLKRIYRRIHRFIVWFPVIWKDEDWDHVYLYEIMRFKISRMRKQIEKNKGHLDWEKTAKGMRIAEILLERQSFSDFYSDNDDKNKEFCTCDDPAWVKHIEEEEEKEKIASEGKYYRKWISPLCEWCCRKIQLHREYKKTKEDYEFMWNHIRKNSMRWWD